VAISFKFLQDHLFIPPSRCSQDQLELATFGFLEKRHSAIIHRTVRCGTRLSSVPAEQRLQRNGQVQQKPEKRYSTQIVRAESEQALEGASDSEQYLSGAAPDCPVAHAIRAPTVKP
jgi:hypothetical protein